MTIAVVAEKPSVARDLAAVLGAGAREQGALRGGGYVVTWVIGHVVRLAEPHEYDPRWKTWRLADLPILPSRFRLVVAEATREQFDNTRRVLEGADVTEIVCATDAGREGELIFRYLYEALGCTKPVRRLWISSLTPAAIAKGFRELKEGRELDRLADAARARSRADWLVGMNLSRAYSLAHDEVYSVGRVQTPTLAMVVARELEIREFVPEDYFEVEATFEAGDEGGAGRYAGTWFREKERRLPKDGEEARRIADRVRSVPGGRGAIESVDRQEHALPPPFLYDLTELQRHANRLFGMSAQRTLDVAQSLYEKRKLLSYPRTDSRKLTRDVAATLPEVVRAIEGSFPGKLAPGTGERPLGARFVDDAKVADHHAIIPTPMRPPTDLPQDEARIYDLVCRRLLSAWHDDHLYAVTKVVTAVTSSQTDRFASSGTSVERAGWKVLDRVASSSAARGETTLPGGLRPGDPAHVLDAKAVAKKTRPPARFTDATLLTAMETAGRVVEDKEIALAMRECGLGTPATRAATLETLLRREYIARDGKSLLATDKGIALIGVVHPDVKSPAMTGQWEAKLGQIEEGKGDLDRFMTEIEGYVRQVVGAAPAAVVRATPTALRPQEPGASLEDLLHDRFGFSSFRPHQEDVCRAATAGRDVLLVMPTGAGKSLCYQLPGIARGGTTLVVSPLIALIEDQVGKLTRHGLAAERIHSGRTRLQSRAACRAYLDGRLDFLFLAPERLKVPGFPEMLARRPPALVAIDEAHCISQWGHDFRPDYRMLGDRLPSLRPAPFVALTATATPAVQDDIAAQLQLRDPARFIHGFRRTNLAIEVVEKSPADRVDAVKALLSDPARRPAIVYTPTRREAEQAAAELAAVARATVYHAGLTTEVREQAQRAFLTGEADVVVATIAFGMGIDKANVRTVVHTALPGSIEGYYQEIGRAGRDGAPAAAVLLYSPVDTRTHEFFHEKNYPSVAILRAMFEELKDRPVAKDALFSSVGLDEEVFEKALEKLWLHGGARIDPDETIRRGAAAFEPSYVRQVAHRLDQIARVRRFAERKACRMLDLVAHFGDRNDPGTPCGLCDRCTPLASAAGALRAPTQGEERVVAALLKQLGQLDGQTVGQLHREVFPRGELDRRSFDHTLGGLARDGLVRLEADSFEKDGVAIAFSRVHLTSRGRAAVPRRRAPEPRHEKAAAPKRGRARRRTKDRRRREVENVPAGSEALLEALRVWRLAAASKLGVPAFHVMSDRTLRDLVTARPAEEASLRRVAGISQGVVSKHSATLLRLIARHAPPVGPSK